MMKKTILEIYALLVCFFTVLCFSICLGIGIYSVVQITNPEFTLSASEYGKHQSNDTFWDCGFRGAYCSDEDKKKQRPSEIELTKKREISFASAIKGEQRDGAQSLVQMLIIIIIDVMLFFAHWVIARKARANVPA